jgi:hypothetical protein
MSFFTVRELEIPGEIYERKTYPFEFSSVEMPYESHNGTNVRLRSANAMFQNSNHTFLISKLHFAPSKLLIVQNTKVTFAHNTVQIDYALHFGTSPTVVMRT